MEYAKNIILELKKGQVLKSERNIKQGKTQKILNKMLEHKIITTIVTLTIAFIICDIMLISSFINVLVKI